MPGWSIGTLLDAVIQRQCEPFIRGRAYAPWRQGGSPGGVLVANEIAGYRPVGVPDRWLGAAECHSRATPALRTIREVTASRAGARTKAGN